MENILGIMSNTPLTLDIILTYTMGMNKAQCECGSKVLKITKIELSLDGDRVVREMICRSCKKVMKQETDLRGTEDKYIFINTPGGRTIQLHRVVWELWNGKTIKTGEIIHHLNGIKSDNRLSNLYLMKECNHLKEGNHSTLRTQIKMLKSRIKVLEGKLCQTKLS